LARDAESLIQVSLRLSSNNFLVNIIEGTQLATAKLKLSINHFVNFFISKLTQAHCVDQRTTQTASNFTTSFIDFICLSLNFSTSFSVDNCLFKSLLLSISLFVSSVFSASLL
jgi:hypothetical protein